MTRVVKSQQGYTATLTIVDQKTRTLFAFPTAGKSSPLRIVKAFLDRYIIGDGRTRYIRTDQGGELERSTKNSLTASLAKLHTGAHRFRCTIWKWSGGET